MTDGGTQDELRRLTLVQDPVGRKSDDNDLPSPELIYCESTPGLGELMMRLFKAAGIEVKARADSTEELFSCLESEFGRRLGRRALICLAHPPLASELATGQPDPSQRPLRYFLEELARSCRRQDQPIALLLSAKQIELLDQHDLEFLDGWLTGDGGRGLIEAKYPLSLPDWPRVFGQIAAGGRAVDPLAGALLKARRYRIAQDPWSRLHRQPAKAELLTILAGLQGGKKVLDMMMGKGSNIIDEQLQELYDISVMRTMEMALVVMERERHDPARSSAYASFPPRAGDQRYRTWSEPPPEVQRAARRDSEERLYSAIDAIDQRAILQYIALDRMLLVPDWRWITSVETGKRIPRLIPLWWRYGDKGPVLQPREDVLNAMQHDLDQAERARYLDEWWH